MTHDERLKLKPGDLVRVRDDHGGEANCWVKCAPWKLHSGEWVIGLKAVDGGYLLSRVVEKLEVCAICQQRVVTEDRSVCETCVPSNHQEILATGKLEIERFRNKLLREALTWAVGFMQCNFPSAERYPDFRNAKSLLDEQGKIITGEFTLARHRAEVAEEKIETLKQVILDAAKHAGIAK